MREARRIFSLVAVIVIGQCAIAQAAGRVELTVLGESQANAEFHQWSQILGKAGAANVRFRAPEPTDQIGIEVQGTPERPVYLVTGQLTGGGQLILPGARFGKSDAARLSQWLARLAEEGPPQQREAKTALGLTARQLSALREELGVAVSFSTLGISCAEAVQKITQQIRTPLRIDPAAGKALAEEKLPVELSGISCGTALAYAARLAGVCLTPRAGTRGIELDLVEARRDIEPWPVGWPADKPDPDVLPDLYEFLTVNIQNVPASTAMEAIAKRLKTPMLLDYNALARHGIEPEKVNVKLPAGRTTYSQALQKVLFQARLKKELRVDDAGRPLLWITSIKPL